MSSIQAALHRMTDAFHADCFLMPSMHIYMILAIFTGQDQLLSEVDASRLALHLELEELKVRKARGEVLILDAVQS